MMENSLESFLQTSVVLIMIFQLPFEGILNRQYFGIFGNSTGQASQAVMIFIGSTIAGFFFMATGLVGYVAKLQNDAMSIKEKMVLILIYLIQIGISLATFTILFLMHSSIHLKIGLVLWASIGLVKFVILLIFGMMKPRISKISDLFRSCCVFPSFCGYESNKEVVYFKSPEYPETSPVAAECNFRVK